MTAEWLAGTGPFLSPPIVQLALGFYDKSAFSQKRRPADCLLLAAISLAPLFLPFLAPGL